MKSLNISAIVEYGANLDMEAVTAKHTADMADFKVSIEQLDEIKASANVEGEISVEALTAMMAKIADQFPRIINSLKASLLQAGKRGEIRYFSESNAVSVKRLEGISISEYMDTKVDIPSGMKGTYVAGMSAVSDVYASMDMPIRLRQGVENLNTVVSSMSKGNMTHESVIKVALKMLTADLKKQETAMKALNKVFTKGGKPLEKKTVSKVFASFDEMKNVRLSLVNLEEMLTAGESNSECVSHMGESLSMVSDFITRSISENDGYGPSDKFIDSLASYVQGIAVGLTNYSEAATIQMAIEHNLVLVYNTLLKA